MKGFTTRAIHSPPPKADAHSALRMPVYDSASFAFEKSADMQAAFEGRKQAHSYSRISNPTIEDFEQRLQRTCDAKAVTAVSSGMAAISCVLLSTCQMGDSVLASRHIFGNTFSLFDKTLRRSGINTHFVDMRDPDQVRASCDDSVRVLFVETITNPQIFVPDITALARIAAEKNILLVVDGTLTTPYLCAVHKLGAHIEVLSSTKYICGGGTAIGGAILDYGTYDYSHNPSLAENARRFGPFALHARLRSDVFRNLGTCTSPHNAWLNSLGMETLALRIDKSTQNARAIASFLESHDTVQAVHYPGLKSSPYYTLAQHQFPSGCGGLLSFELADKSQAFAFMDSLKIVRRSTNLNDNKTLVLHPASTIFCEYSPQERTHMAVTDGLVRLSVGIEDCDDILEDIHQGLGLL